MSIDQNKLKIAAGRIDSLVSRVDALIDRRQSTDLTKKWRVIVRGELKRETEQARMKTEEDRLNRKGYFSPDREERRILSCLPGAEFDDKGNLSNVEEMRRKYEVRNRR